MLWPSSVSMADSDTWPTPPALGSPRASAARPWCWAAAPAASAPCRIGSCGCCPPGGALLRPGWPGDASPPASRPAPAGRQPAAGQRQRRSRPGSHSTVRPRVMRHPSGSGSRTETRQRVQQNHGGRRPGLLSRPSVSSRRGLAGAQIDLRASIALVTRLRSNHVAPGLQDHGRLGLAGCPHVAPGLVAHVPEHVAQRRTCRRPGAASARAA